MYDLKTSALSVVHTCVDFESLQRLKPRPRRDGLVRLVYAGRLYYRKGIAHLLEIISHLSRELGVSNFHLNIFGSGPLERTLNRYVLRNGLSELVSFNGFVSRERLLRGLVESDIVCVPSLYEACPVLMIEAMCLGKPIAAFDLPFARELLGTSASELVGRGTDAFASILKHLVNSYEDRARLGEILRSNARRFDSGKIALDYRSIYNELM
jgi:glycosyltransferase involved in cell wall biosynthesis